MGNIQQIEQNNALLKEQLLIKDQHIKRKNERILYLERQLFGRRSEKRLPDYCSAQLSLFDPQQGTQILEQESHELTSLIEEIKQKAEKRRTLKKAHAISHKRSYKIPTSIERRETIINPKTLILVI